MEFYEIESMKINSGSYQHFNFEVGFFIFANRHKNNWLTKLSKHQRKKVAMREASRCRKWHNFFAVPKGILILVHTKKRTLYFKSDTYLTFFHEKNCTFTWICKATSQAKIKSIIHFDRIYQEKKKKKIRYGDI